MPSVLVVEDDPSIRQSLIEVLAEHGYAVRSTGDGFGALREVTRTPVDAVVLDLGLPDLDGGDALRMIRGISSVPVLVATARDDEAEIISLLNAGADDYLVKPFSGGQLVARLSAVLRRSGHVPPVSPMPGIAPMAPMSPRSPVHPMPSTGPGSAVPVPRGASAPPVPPVAGGGPRPVTVGELSVDPGARTAYLAGVELRLTRREFDLLAFLALHAGQVVSKRRLLTEVWREPYVDDQTVDVHLSSLRRKLGERAAAPRYLLTVRGVGIKLVAPR
ncbi:response regulator [Streptomyces sp. NPDC086023]|uniref:response regulator n=1 Tax=Streptomyces sp. NPDC086023 TaxID=3365746 RepID=UPI0037D45B32